MQRLLAQLAQAGSRVVAHVQHLWDGGVGGWGLDALS